MSPDTLTQDNLPRFARIGAPQAMRTPLVPQWNEHEYLYQSRPISCDPPMLLLVDPSSLHSIPVPYVEYAREHPSRDPTNTAGEFPSLLHLFSCWSLCWLGWLRTTFKHSEEAEEALLADRPRFLQQHGILCLLPQDIRKCIAYNGDNGQINGFEKLFVYLECSSAAGELRERIVAYFYSSPHLRGHLSTSTHLVVASYFLNSSYQFFVDLFQRLTETTLYNGLRALMQLWELLYMDSYDGADSYPDTYADRGSADCPPIQHNTDSIPSSSSIHSRSFVLFTFPVTCDSTTQSKEILKSSSESQIQRPAPLGLEFIIWMVNAGTFPSSSQISLFLQKWIPLIHVTAPPDALTAWASRPWQDYDLAYFSRPCRWRD